MSAVIGLSPLARGTQFALRYSSNCFRFIPAGAGNTEPLSTSVDSRTVYPRWRGEHGKGGVVLFQHHGLSPLARGTQNVTIAINMRCRFIPAGAGNTAMGGICAHQDAVYPRWRGEHLRRNSITAAGDGLSPLARGTHHYDFVNGAYARFIPAGAGNTD